MGLVAITLSIPFAIASGAGADAPAIGLITVVVAGGVAALFGGSRVLATGPVGGLIVVLAGLAQRHGLDGLLVTTMMAGAILVLAGLLRLGQVVKYVPYPVTVGFTAGLAIVIALGQFPTLLGTPTATAGAAWRTAWLALEAAARGAWQPWTAATAVATVALIAAGGRLLPRVPNIVTGLVAATALVHLFSIPTPLIGDRYLLGDGLPTPGLPDWDWRDLGELVPDAFTLAFLIALQSLLAAVVADGMTRTRHDSDQELIGQGLANLAAPLFGGIAAAGAVARTATGIQNGARTPVAALVHVGVVLAALVVLAPVVALVPLAVLAGVLVMVCWTMSQRQHLRRLLRMPRQDAGILLCTLVLTVAVGLNVAIAVGMVLAVGLFIGRMGAATRVLPATAAPEADAEAVLTFRPEDVPSDVVVYSIQGALFFGAADQFRDAMARMGQRPRAVIFRMRDVPYLDSTALNVLLTSVEELRRAGTRVLLTGIRSQPLEAMEEAEAVHVLGQENLFRTTAEALAELKAGPGAGGAAPA